ncbi:MAG: NAD(P)-binding protein, partial [Acidimicrobiales bacterium]
MQIVGGGLAGLIAANLALDAGLSVRLLEKQRSLGGRAASADHEGFTLNQGPHALYLDGELNAALRTLSITPVGSPPGLKGAIGRIGSKRDLLPQGPGSLLRTTLLSGRSKRRLVAFMARLPRMDTGSLDSVTIDDWLDDFTDQPDLRALLWGLLNLSTYNSTSDLASAGAALSQLQMAMGDGVIYLDGGWGTIVDALDDRLAQHPETKVGRFQRLTAMVNEIAPAPDGPPTEPGYVCRCTDGEYGAANIVVAAGLPAVAERLLGEAGLTER